MATTRHARRKAAKKRNAEHTERLAKAARAYDIAKTVSNNLSNPAFKFSARSPKSMRKHSRLYSGETSPRYTGR